jgi:anaerobic ribonucleoside-triphosphate reductase
MEEKKEIRRIITEIYSRVSGYFRPTIQWNKGKQEEFAQRRDLINSIYKK